MGVFVSGRQGYDDRGSSLCLCSSSHENRKRDDKLRRLGSAEIQAQEILTTVPEAFEVSGQ